MSKSKQQGLSWRVHFFAGSFLVLAVATFITLIIRCERESVTVGEVSAMWLGFPGSDEPIPGADLARVELLSNSVMLGILGASSYAVALIARNLTLQSLTDKSADPRRTLRTWVVSAWLGIILRALNLALAGWLAFTLHQMGADLPSGFAAAFRGFEIGKLYHPGQIALHGGVSAIVARLLTAAFLLGLGAFILRKHKSIQGQLDRLAC